MPPPILALPQSCKGAREEQHGDLAVGQAGGAIICQDFGRFWSQVLRFGCKS
uniref:Uncharacterized protein n=1 Tax=Arundo donax TaxID=35708 RepID=A0A0A9HLA6_ARUDO